VRFSCAASLMSGPAVLLEPAVQTLDVCDLHRGMAHTSNHTDSTRPAQHQRRIRGTQTALATVVNSIIRRHNVTPKTSLYLLVPIFDRILGTLTYNVLAGNLPKALDAAPLTANGVFTTVRYIKQTSGLLRMCLQPAGVRAQGRRPQCLPLPGRPVSGVRSGSATATETALPACPPTAVLGPHAALLLATACLLSCLHRVGHGVAGRCQHNFFRAAIPSARCAGCCEWPSWPRLLLRQCDCDLGWRFGRASWGR
jgi:hypothetical protein